MLRKKLGIRRGFLYCLHERLYLLFYCCCWWKMKGWRLNDSFSFQHLCLSVHEHAYLSIYLSGCWQVKLFGRGLCFSKQGQTAASLVWRLLFLTNSNYFPLMSSRSGWCASPPSLLWGQQLQCWDWLAAYTDLFSLTDCRMLFLTAGSRPPGARWAHTHRNTQAHGCMNLCCHSELI